MKQWWLDVFKIGLGVSLGFVFLIVLAFALEDWVWPATQVEARFSLSASMQSTLEAH